MTRCLSHTQVDALIWSQSYAATGPHGAETDAAHRAQCLREKLASRDFDGFLSLCARGNRWQVLRTLARTLTDAEYWPLLRTVYQDTETLWQQRSAGRLLTAARAGREGFMTEPERAALARLPDRLTIHRGAQLHNVEGWSWTLDAGKARWFALRWDCDVGLIVHGQVARSDVIGYLADRDEAEVVCNPAIVMLESVDVVHPAADPPSIR